MTAAHWLWVLFLFGVGWVIVGSALLWPFALWGLAFMAAPPLLNALAINARKTK